MKTLSDEQLKAYFLGKLSETEAEILEMEFAADAESTEHLQLVERELGDDYLGGNLAPADALLFETNYLITEARRKKLRVANALRVTAREQKIAALAAPAAASASFWQAVFGKQYRFQMALGGLFLLLVFGAVAFYLLNLNVAKIEIAEVKDPIPPLPKIENPVIQSEETDKPDKQITSVNPVIQNKEVNKNPALTQKTLPEAKTVPAPKSVEQNAPTLAIFALLPGSLRSEGDGEQFISIAPKVKDVSLNLKLPRDAGKYSIYRAVLKIAGGDTIFTIPKLSSFGLTIPAEKLENRTYMIHLEGQDAKGEFESVAEYTFRVRR